MGNSERALKLLLDAVEQSIVFFYHLYFLILNFQTKQNNTIQKTKGTNDLHKFVLENPKAAKVFLLNK